MDMSVYWSVMVGILTMTVLKQVKEKLVNLCFKIRMVSIENKCVTFIKIKDKARNYQCDMGLTAISFLCQRTKKFRAQNCIHRNMFSACNWTTCTEQLECFVYYRIFKLLCCKDFLHKRFVWDNCFSHSDEYYWILRIKTSQELIFDSS